MRNCSWPFVLLVIVGSTPVDAQTKHWVNPAGPVEGMPQKGVVDTIHFETDTAVIVSGQVTLKCVVEAMKKDKDLFAVVEGFADGRGSEAYNLRLSEARAKAVTRYMDALGADNQRIHGIGLGRVGRPEDPVTNFARRKAMVVLRRGSFKGTIVTELPSMPLPCNRGPEDQNSATIEANGQVFKIEVDYAKIRRDFRAEIVAMMAERDERKLATDGAQEARGEKAGEGGGSNGKGAQALPDAASARSRVESRSEGTNSYRVTVGGSKVTLKPTTGVKSESGVGNIDAGWLFAVKGGAFQVGMQGEAGSYRRRGQLDLAYSVLSGPFMGTAWIGWGVVSGAPTDAPVVLGNRQGMLFGGRLGGRWSYVNLGAFYANASSPQAGTGQPAQEPTGMVGGDLTLGTDRMNLRLMAYNALNPQHQVASEVPKINSKTGFGAQFFWQTGESVGLLLKAESYPTYATYSLKNEQRIGFGVRFGGSRLDVGSQPGWVEIPSVRTIFPF